MRQNHAAVWQLNLKGCVGQCFFDYAFQFNYIVFRHINQHSFPDVLYICISYFKFPCASFQHLSTSRILLSVHRHSSFTACFVAAACIGFFFFGLVKGLCLPSHKSRNLPCTSITTRKLPLSRPDTDLTICPLLNSMQPP